MPNTEKPKAKKAAKKSAKPSKVKSTKQRKRRKIERHSNRSFVDSDGKLTFLTEKQYQFCMWYLKLYGKRIDAIIEAGYDVYKRDSKGKKTDQINYNLARSMAGENLQKPAITGFITSKLSEFGWDDENVDLQHLALINQYDNLPTKQRAIADYNKLKGRYPSEKVKHTGEIGFVEITNYGSKGKDAGS